jgi:hypothetical protein
MNKQEQALNAKSKLTRIFNIRKNHLITLEQELINNPSNCELKAKVVSYRAFIAREEAMMNRMIAKIEQVA